MLIGIIENGVVSRVGHYKSIFPNTSFTSNGPSDDFLEEFNAKRVNTFIAHDPLTHKLVSSTPYVDGVWVYTVRVEELSAEEITEQKNARWGKVRAQRNIMLGDCDWTQLSDAPGENKTEWANYRQALRDITTQDDPYNLTWPTKPGETAPEATESVSESTAETETVVTTTSTES